MSQATEASLRETAEGLVAEGEGWFVITLVSRAGAAGLVAAQGSGVLLMCPIVQ